MSKSKFMKVKERVLTFSKAQLSAFVGGLTDYSIMVFLTEVFKIHYTFSIVIGGIIGAFVNFYFNRKWTFKSKNIPYKNSTSAQMYKFGFVVVNSILLKTVFTYLITTYLKIDYKISRLIVDLFVSIIINYNLQRRWVFKKTKLTKP